MPTSRGKGRQSIPVIEETSEERLPVNTRFPPRSAVTPTVQILSNVDETTKKISIKRPSLELVDSQSFNRGEKGQSKGSRVLENEFAKANDVKTSENPTIVPSVTEIVGSHNVGTNDVTTAATAPSSAAGQAGGAGAAAVVAAASTSDNEETTTQIMDKVALDLYAHLVNENSNIDSSTGAALYDESSTYDSLVNQSTAALNNQIITNFDIFIFFLFFFFSTYSHMNSSQRRKILRQLKRQQPQQLKLQQQLAQPQQPKRHSLMDVVHHSVQV